MSANNFVHLNVHSEYSLKDSLVSVKDLISGTKSLGMGAVAISDLSNMYAAVKHYKKSMESGIKPIISAELTIAFENKIGQINLIAQNDDGYKNLTELITRGYEEGQLIDGEPPVIDISWLKGKTSGLIALSGARKGLIGKALLADNIDFAHENAYVMKELFDDRFYIELQRIGHPDDDKYIHKAVEFAVTHDIPVVATNAVVFMKQDDYHTHEVRSAISKKTSVDQLRQNDPYAHTKEQYFKSPDEMKELFYDIPSAIENSVEIARRCSIEITLGKSFLPAFPVPDGMDENSFLDHASYDGLNERLAFLYDVNDPSFEKTKKKYFDRLDFELNVIKQMGFPGYFLIVMDFIQWSKDNKIPVGPGRGSGAGSLVAYALKITDLDPLEYDLLFERFLNPERVSMPDFDVDFCMDRRGEVIDYVSHKYGESSVAQIVTFGTMAAKMVVRDVARATGYPYAVGNRISNMIPSKPGTKLRDAIEENTELKLAIETDSDVRVIIEHSLKLEGKARQTGKHAGGVVIAPGKTTDFSPTQNEISKTGEIINKVTQFDKNDVEDAGLVKFDFLGLKTLTIAQNAVNNINAKRIRNGEEILKIESIPLDDKDVFSLFQEGRTTAVFQVESKGMKDLLKRMRPDTFEDIIALVALYRPGPLESGMVDNFINRKHGREEVSYPDAKYQHESLKEILEPTYGVILYQEQVMQIAQVLAGYSLGGADMLRRAMGKKKPEEMAKQRAGFEQGAIDNGIDGTLAIKIFDLVEKFAGYGFNKSHSAAYALIAYQTAWLKTHYPAEFMAAVLSGDMDNTDKIVTYVNECRNMNINILPPNLNKSIKSFSPTDDGEILYGMGAVKGVGESAIHTILNERNKSGPYKSLYDYCMRCNANKTTIEAGIRSGILDSMGPGRSSLMATYPKAASVGKQASKIEKDSPQMGMFGSIMDDPELIKFENVPEWDDLYRLAGERKTLGLYLTGHPIDTYEEELSHVISGKLADLAGSNMEDGNEDLEATEETASIKWEDKNVTVAGLIMEMDIRQNKRGQTGFITLDDKSRQIEVMIFNKTLHNCQHVLHPDTTVVIEGKLKMDKKTKRIRLFAYDVKSVDMIRERNASSIMLKLNSDNFNGDVSANLKALMKTQPEGYATLNAHYKTEQHDKRMQLGDETIKITDKLINELKVMFGNDNVEIQYKDKSPTLGAKGKEASEAQKLVKIEEGQRTRITRHNQMAAALENARMAMGM